MDMSNLSLDVLTNRLDELEEAAADCWTDTQEPNIEHHEKMIRDSRLKAVLRLHEEAYAWFAYRLYVLGES
jgi:hypothetical protein